MCVSMLTYIYIYMLVSGCPPVRVYVSCTWFLFLYVYMYMNILQFFFYGIAGKEDRKIKQLNEK